MVIEPTTRDQVSAPVCGFGWPNKSAALQICGWKQDMDGVYAPLKESESFRQNVTARKKYDAAESKKKNKSPEQLTWLRQYYFKDALILATSTIAFMII